MEMHQVRYFLAAAETLNFTRAAEQSHVSQPALTNAIRKLEAELGAPLFHREGKRLLLTDFGATVQPHLRHILERTEAVQTAAQNLRLLHQVPVRLGVMTTIGPVRLSRFFGSFQSENPGVELAVREGEIKELTHLLESGEIDLAILNAGDGLANGCRTEPLYRERYVVVFSAEHRFGRLNAVPLSEVSGEPYVDRLACEMREMVTGVCGDRRVELYARFRSEREDWVQAMVLAGIGFAFMPEFAVTLPGIVSRPLIEPSLERTISLASMPGRPHAPAAAALIRAARRHAWPG